ncbi:hypothetical protein DITRI_Ditri05aG0011800 [Diplodiscus trichospermus]
MLARVCLGTAAKVSNETFGAMDHTYTVIGVSLLCKIAALRAFSLDKLHYWRERFSGMSSLAYFLSKDTMDHFHTIIKHLAYLSMFYFFNNPRSSVTDNYFVLVCLWSVLVPVVLTLIATHDDNSKFVDFIAVVC